MQNSRFSFSAQRRASGGYRFLSLVVSAATALVPCAASARMLDLGWLPFWEFSQASAVSGDGQVVAGHALSSSNEHDLFLWTEQRGMTVFAHAATALEVAALNRDGSVAVGYFTQAGASQAYRWTAGSGMQALGTLGGITSRAYAVSADGSAVVGSAEDGAAVVQAFRWTSTSGMQVLTGLLASGGSTAFGISADGAVVVGASTGSQGRRAVRWQNGILEDLGTLAGNTSSEAFGVSADGNVVVGASDADAFRWSAASGMQSLGSLGGMLNAATATSADGSVVVGTSSLVDGSARAFGWTASTGMVDLGVLSGGTYSSAYGVSHDGSVIVGEGDSAQGYRAVVWSSRSTAGAVAQDLGNLQASVLASADTLTRLRDAEGRRSVELAQQHCIPGTTQRYCLALSGDSQWAGAVDGSRQDWAMLLMGRRFDERWSMGLNALLAQGRLDSSAARQSGSYGVGTWLAYQQDASRGLGWNAWASVGASKGDARFERGEHLANVQAASTRVQINSRAQQMAVGYGVLLGNSQLMPELGFRRGRTGHPAFAERDVDFALQVAGDQVDSRYASLGLRSTTALDGYNTLHLELAVDHLLGDAQPSFAGRSSIPGFSEFALHPRLQQRTRVPRGAMQLGHAFNPQTQVTASLQVEASPYAHEPAMVGIGARLSYRF